VATGPQVPATPANPWSITTGATNATVAPPTPKADAAPTFNLGVGNVGSLNVGSGNQGDWNLGNGNLGSGNIGSGNLGGNNFGIGNNGSGNFGGGNTGTGNIGFGNTGTGNIGIGLTGNNQFGIGGLNSGTGNMGLFNSGTGNVGIFNSGTGNWGFGNSGMRNTGSFNSGNTNTGDANVGNLNTGSFNVGSSNSGSFNTGSTNSGDFNSGDLNTGWFNTGDANTGLFNSGYLNTGIFNSGNASNGFFETEDNQNWFPGIQVAYTIPGFTIDRMLPIDIGTQIPVGPLTVTIGPTTTDVHVYGSTGPIELTVLDIAAGPGFFNTGTIASSGFFNTGAGGGSGLLNTGAGLVSGFFNLAFLAGAAMSGYSNSGSGSGFSNLGSAVSGWRNTSSLSLSEPAYLSGIENFGALLSGYYINGVTGGSTFNLGAGNVGSLNFGDGNVGDNNLGAGNDGNGNWGFGNAGNANLGSGNAGDKNLGGGNIGSGNLGSGNLGSNNWGWGNNGGSNFGAGNTGNGNIGFGNTGNNNIGIGLTGDNQFGIGGLNSGSGNNGLFNSGTGNTGIFNSGTNNWGFGNAGNLNTGLFNTGSTSTGLGNSGDFNTGSHNAGNSNTGNANVGDTNSGVANIGNTNTGWSNTGNANTGWVNTGNLNTGAYNTANGSNGLFWRRDAGGQLNIDLGADLSQVPITLTGDIPVNIPITAELTNPISIPSIDLPVSPIDASITTQLELAPGINADVVINAVGSLGPITFPGTNITVPQLVGTLGGPDTSIPIVLNGTLGPGRISLFRLGGPGLFNSSDAPSSGLFNYGAGEGSGFFNDGAAVISGWMNTALQSGLSGANNTGSGSGFDNLGSAISGYSNTSTLDPALSAFVSGLLNLGTNLSGLFVNVGSGSLRGGGGSAKAEGGWSLGIDTNVDISEIPINITGDIGLNVPLSASLTGPITIDGFTIPTIPAQLTSPGSTLSLTVPSLFGPAVIPLSTDIGIGPITVPDINITSADPLLSGLIGGPGVSIPINISGAIGPNYGPGGGGNAKFSLTRTDTPGLGANIHANVAQTPIKLNADVPVDIPFFADFADLTLQGFTIPGFNITTSNWQTVRNQPTSAPLGNVFLDFNVPGTVLPVGDINVDPITIGLPTLSGNIGGPGAGFGLNLDAGLGPFTIDVPIGLTTDPLGINLDQVLVSQIPIFANVAVPVDLPVSLSATPITISPITIPQVTIGTPPSGNTLQGLVFQGAIKGLTTPPGSSFLRPMCSQVCVALQLSPVINLGPITAGPIELGFPDDQVLALNIGGPGKGATVDATGLLGPIAVSLASGTIDAFPYSYLVNVGVDVPIDGSTGSLDLQQTDLSVPLQALLYQRVGYCAALGVTCGGGLTVAAFNTYINGGSPAGSAPGPFPSNVTVATSTLADTNLGGPIGPLTLIASMTISQGITSSTTNSGSGTLGPFNLGGAA
jgi:PPE-repeat protein